MCDDLNMKERDLTFVVSPLRARQTPSFTTRQFNMQTQIQVGEKGETTYKNCYIRVGQLLDDAACHLAAVMLKQETGQ